MKPFRIRLRLRLLMVALAAAAPAIAAVAVTQSMARQRARALTLTDNLRLVRLAADQQANVFNGARLLLLTLAEVPELRGNDPRLCREMLPKVLHAHPRYLALMAIDADRTIFCSTTGIGRAALPDPAAGDWFDRAARGRATVVGEDLRSDGGARSMVVAHPMLDAAGAVSRVLVAAIDLHELSDVMVRADLPSGGTLTLIDRAGIILARVPGGRSWVGHQVPGALSAESPEEMSSERTNDTVGVDGVRRLYVTVPLRAAIATGITLSLGIDHSAAFRESDRIYRGYLWLLGIVSLVGIAAAAAGNHLFVIRPINAMKTVADRIAGGDLGARAQLAGSVGAVSELGDAVNAMAGALDTRARERDAAERELRESEDRYRLLFTQNPHPMWVYDLATLAFLEVNNAAVKDYGYSREEFLAMRITDIRPAEDVPRLLASVKGPRDPLMRSNDWRHLKKSGEIIDVEITSHTLDFAGRSAILVCAQDVTVRTRAEAALAERARLTTVSAEVGASLNRPGDLQAGIQSCAEAMVAHLDLKTVTIWLNDPRGALRAVAGDRLEDAEREHDCTRRWPLAVGDRTVGGLAVFARTPLSEGTITGLASVSAMIALGVTRHQSEDARRLLATIVAGSDEAIYGTDANGTIVTWNEGAERLFGYPADAAIGRSVAMLYPPDLQHELPDLLARLRRGEHVRHFDTVRRRQDGSVVSVSLSLSHIKDETGRFAIVSCIARDTTQQQRAEQQIRLLARALESTNEMVSITDNDDRFTFVNAAFLRAYGYAADEVIGQTPAMIQSSRTSEAMFQDILRDSRGHGWSGELLNRRRDGSEFFVSLNTSAVRNDQGAIIGLLGVARDISERLRAERALREAEERMRFALEASNVGVWEANLATGAAFWSETSEAMHGLEPGTFGRTFDAFVACLHPDDRDATCKTIDDAIRARKAVDLEYRTRWPDGTVRQISLIAHFSFDERGVPVRAAGVSLDVTEKRSLEDQLRQSQKMEAIGQLAGGIAHDFNNLLTVILGCASFLAHDVPESDARHADVDEILRAAQRAAALTGQLLAFSRKQILEVRVLQLGDVVAEVTPMLRRLIGETIDLQTVVDNRGLVKTDPGQLQQVIVNLAVNARDAMPEGGRLILETSDVEIDETFARRHPSLRPGPYVMLAVRDTGHGMDAETQKRVFEPFFTTKPLGRGTGLGLATVYGIVKQTGGTISVESEVNRGTTFTIYLPRTDEVVEIERPAPAASAAGGTETILVVEDEGPVCEFIEKVLVRRGYTVHAVDDPIAALAYAEANHERIDLVCSDVILPHMGGREMAARMRQCHPESAVLFMSGYTEQDFARDGILEDSAAFLHKPFTADGLAKKVREILDAHVPPPPHAGQPETDRLNGPEYHA